MNSTALKEEQMPAKNAWWTAVVGGIVWAMLWAGPVEAQPFPGGLPACEASLKTCTTSLNSCTTSLTQTQGQLNMCTSSLTQTQGQLNMCTTDLGQCHTDLAACLAACQPEPIVVFPGDGVDGPALSYTDNGDGTFTDNNTLLMWEKKDSSLGIHGVDNTYSWSSSQCSGHRDGTAFTVFLAALNTNPCFAGHCDWRLPNIRELHSIVDYSVAVPGTASSVPGATAAEDYWSSTATLLSFGGPSCLAFDVNFFNGFVFANDTSFTLRARAVRGGQ